MRRETKCLSEFRANIDSFIDIVQNSKRPLFLTQQGKSVAVILTVSEYERLLDRLELLTDIQIAESQLSTEGLSNNDVKAQILANSKKSVLD